MAYIEEHVLVDSKTFGDGSKFPGKEGDTVYVGVRTFKYINGGWVETFSAKEESPKVME